MTSVPKPLKILRDKFELLRETFDTMVRMLYTYTDTHREEKSGVVYTVWRFYFTGLNFRK